MVAAIINAANSDTATPFLMRVPDRRTGAGCPPRLSRLGNLKERDSSLLVLGGI